MSYLVVRVKYDGSPQFNYPNVTPTNYPKLIFGEKKNFHETLSGYIFQWMWQLQVET